RLSSFGRSTGSCKITSSAAGAREGFQESYTAMRQILFSHLPAIIEWLGSEKPQSIRLQGTQMTDKRRPFFVPTEGIALYAYSNRTLESIDRNSSAYFIARMRVGIAVHFSFGAESRLRRSVDTVSAKNVLHRLKNASEFLESLDATPKSPPRVRNFVAIKS